MPGAAVPAAGAVVVALIQNRPLGDDQQQVTRPVCGGCTMTERSTHTLGTAPMAQGRPYNVFSSPGTISHANCSQFPHLAVAELRFTPQGFPMCSPWRRWRRRCQCAEGRAAPQGTSKGPGPSSCAHRAPSWAALGAPLRTGERLFGARSPHNSAPR